MAAAYDPGRRRSEPVVLYLGTVGTRLAPDKGECAMEMTVVAEGLRFPEGPVALPDGSVLVVEIAGQCLSRVHPDGRVDDGGQRLQQCEERTAKQPWLLSRRDCDAAPAA